MDAGVRGMLWLLAKCITIPIALGFAVVFGYQLGSPVVSPMHDWPNLPGCKLTAVARYPNAETSDLATILKRDCNDGTNIVYFLRLDVNGRQSGHTGFLSFTELENDAYPVSEPKVAWTKNTVQVLVHTRTLEGKLVVNQGYDTTIVRMFKPREPGAFPN